MRLRPLVVAGTLLASAAPLVAQQRSSFELTIPNIMRGPELYGREPSGVRWTLDGKWVYFSWLEPGSDWRLSPRQFRVSTVPGSKPERVPNGAPEPIFADAGRASRDGKMRLVSAGGNITLVDVATGTRRVLVRSLTPKSNVMFSADEREVLYVESNNAFALSLDSLSTRQLTDIRTQAEGRGAGPGVALAGRAGGGAAQRTDSSLTQRAALAAQQKTLFQVIRDRAFQDSLNRAEGGRGGRGGGRGGRGGGGPADGGDAGIGIRTFSITGTDRVGGVAISTTGRAALVTVVTPAATTATSTLVPSWVTSTGYVEEINGRAKVGDSPAAATRIGFQSLPNGNVQWLAVSPPGRPASSNAVGWNESGTAALIFSNSSDFKDRWLYSVTDNGKVNLIEALHDSAWVGGPCNRCAGFYDGGQRIYYVSEADGYAHLYTITSPVPTSSS